MAQTAANHTGKGVERHTEIKYKNNRPEAAGFGADFCIRKPRDSHVVQKSLNSEQCNRIDCNDKKPPSDEGGDFVG